MLSKEEKESIELKKQIEQLESDKQKLIEKLEEDIEEYRKCMDKTDIKLNKIHYMKRIEYAKEILEILKGENDE